jgi:hypothetical protein
VPRIWLATGIIRLSDYVITAEHEIVVAVETRPA